MLVWLKVCTPFSTVFFARKVCWPFLCIYIYFIVHEKCLDSNSRGLLRQQGVLRTWPAIFIICCLWIQFLGTARHSGEDWALEDCEWWRIRGGYEQGQFVRGQSVQVGVFPTYIPRVLQCLSPRWNLGLPTLSPAREFAPLPPEPKGSPADEGVVVESQFSATGVKA